VIKNIRSKTQIVLILETLTKKKMKFMTVCIVFLLVCFLFGQQVASEATNGKNKLKAHRLQAENDVKDDRKLDANDCNCYPDCDDGYQCDCVNAYPLCIPIL
jgi:hypothetical protein